MANLILDQSLKGVQANCLCKDNQQRVRRPPVLCWDFIPFRAMNH